MKIRNGFVSNSSSASFIIDDDKMTTARVAKIMAKDIRNDWLEDGLDEENIQFLNEFMNNVNKLVDSYDDPIIFTFTTNYETFIIKIDDTIYIDTCNNIHWESFDDIDWIDYHGDGFYESDSPDFNWCKYQWYNPVKQKYTNSPYCYHDKYDLCPNNENTPDWAKSM